MNATEKKQVKIIVCLIGIVILFVIALALLVHKIPIDKPPIHIPEVETLYNVWITEVTEDYICVYDGERRVCIISETLKNGDLEKAREQIADITLTDGALTEIRIKNTEKITGKVLRVIDGFGVEIEGMGTLEFDDNVGMYLLYDSLAVADEKDIRIGYSFCDFVLDEGKVCGVLVTRDQSMEYIRVQIKTSDYKALVHDKVRFTADTDYILRYEGTEGVAEEFHNSGEEIEITADSEYLQYGRAYIVPVALTGKITLLSVKRNQGTPSYRGVLELAKSEEGIYVINELLLEEYLYSVVPSEMPSDYPLEALKAQAICARTYAYGHMLKTSARLYGAHVDDSSTYQVYNNIPENEQTTTAVRETSGQLLYVRGNMGEIPADTYYYSTSCGFGTETDIWKGTATESLDYLPAKRIANTVWLTTQGEPDGKYTANSLMDEDVFAEFIGSTFPSDYEETEPWYRWKYSVEEIDTERMLSVLQTRYEANSKLILTRDKKGAFVSKPIKKLGDIKEIAVILRNEGGIADELLIETDSQIIKVISEYNIRSVLCDGVTKVVRQDGSKVSMPSLLPSAFLVITTGKEDENVVGYTIVGGGFGHGVGMSQNGARQMAVRGISATEILGFFYEGSNVKKLY